MRGRWKEREARLNSCQDLVLRGHRRKKCDVTLFGGLIGSGTGDSLFLTVRFFHFIFRGISSVGNFDFGWPTAERTRY